MASLALVTAESTSSSVPMMPTPSSGVSTGLVTPAGYQHAGLDTGTRLCYYDLMSNTDADNIVRQRLNAIAEQVEFCQQLAKEIEYTGRTTNERKLAEVRGALAIELSGLQEMVNEIA